MNGARRAQAAVAIGGPSQVGAVLVGGVHGERQHGVAFRFGMVSRTPRTAPAQVVPQCSCRCRPAADRERRERHHPLTGGHGFESGRRRPIGRSSLAPARVAVRAYRISRSRRYRIAAAAGVSAAGSLRSKRSMTRSTSARVVVWFMTQTRRA